MKKVRKLTNLLFSIGYFIFFIPLLVSVLSFSFNNSDFNNSYQVPSVQYEYQTNEVNSTSDLVNGNIYKFQCDYTQFTSSQSILTAYGMFANESDMVRYTTSDSIMYITYLTANDALAFNLNGYKSTFYDVSDLDYIYIVYNGIISNLITYENFSISDYLGDTTVVYNDSSLVDIALSNYNPSDSTSNANMANFLDSVGEVTIFSWCTDVSSYLFGGVSSFAYYWFLWTLVYLELFLFMQFFIWLFELIQLLGNKFLQKGE